MKVSSIVIKQIALYQERILQVQTSWTKGLKTVYFLAPDSFSKVIPELSRRWNSSSLNQMIVTFIGEKLDENSSVF